MDFTNGFTAQALEGFQKCISSLEIPPDQGWFSRYAIARIRHESGLSDLRSIIQGYAEAYDFCPARLEPVAHLARLYREQGDQQTAYELSRLVLTTPRPDESALFLEAVVYDLLLPLEFVLACRSLGRGSESAHVAEYLLALPELPGAVRQLVLGNKDDLSHSYRSEYLTFVLPGWWET
ncbi:MAG: hypothetical protein HY299_23015 [Verrucomicrobia bacterium]|nr:hypothetical protein [Verrucomicrobiota bacterium]